MKKVLVLGAGLVARPLVRYLLARPDYEVVVASRTVSKADELIEGHPRGKAVAFDIEKDASPLDGLVAGVDLAVSLLPYIHHVQVAKSCLKHRKHLVTTSYVSDAMRALDAQAKEAGILFLNEIGLDPGTDHMSAMRVIDRVHAAGGKIESFRSCCGGLPAPDANDNPLGYKFSWSPRGVVLAGRNNARFLENGAVINVPNARLFATHSLSKVEGLGYLEIYPNRDSLPYMDIYSIPETKTMFRGTFRNVGWCDVFQKLNELGYFNLDERKDLAGKTFRDVLAGLLGKPKNAELEDELAYFLNVSPASGVMAAFRWLGLLDESPVSPKAPTSLDVLADQLLAKMGYGDGERDMVVLVHDFVAVYGDRRERITSTLLDFGVPGGDSSMSRTVALPAAIGVRMILDGQIKMTGVRIPVLKEIYDPVLNELATLGVVCKERAESLD